MIARHEVLISLYGTWRLFLRDPRGIEWLDDSVDGFWKSFFCAVLILPFYALLLASTDGAAGNAGFFRFVTVEGISYVIQWVAWPLIMAYLAPAIDRDENYIRYIVAYNWSAGIQMAIYMIVLALKLGGVATGGLLVVIFLIAKVVVLLYHWYVVRVALEVSGVGAAALVAGDFVLSYVILGVTQDMLQ